MPLRLPNAFIYLNALVRPSTLRPDLRVKTIAHVDFQGLRRAGFNAVVVDKDNCVTLPHQDEVYGPFKDAWRDLLSTFPPGRVLVVSNSAGSLKDPYGVEAELLSYSLNAPVLLHARPKPGCAPDILAYFRGLLGTPTTTAKRIKDQSEKLEEDVRKQMDEIITDVLPVADLKSAPLPSNGQGPDTAVSTVSSTPLSQKPVLSAEALREDLHADPRILVIGDRLFTDTLLARRLSLLFHTPSASPPSIPNVLSICATALPQPHDLRPIRWLEEALSRGKVRRSAVDWSQHAMDNTPVDDAMANLSTTVQARVERFEGQVADSRLGWDPRKRTAFDLSIGLGRGTSWIGRNVWAGLTWLGRYTWIGVARLAQFTWARARRWYDMRRATVAAKTIESMPEVDPSKSLPPPAPLKQIPSPPIQAVHPRPAHTAEADHSEHGSENQPISRHA